MIVIGITGGIGSGKTSAAKLFSEKGYKVIFTDERAKMLMQTSPTIKRKLTSIFGESAYAKDGTLNREYLAEKVFGDNPSSKENLRKLNSIVHPEVIADMLSETERLEQAGEKLVFIESALIYEAALEDGFDYIIVVDSPEEMCISRTVARSGITADQVKGRMNEQIHINEKKAHAEFVIDNSGTFQDLQKAVDFLLPILEILPPKPDIEE